MSYPVSTIRSYADSLVSQEDKGALLGLLEQIETTNINEMQVVTAGALHAALIGTRQEYLLADLAQNWMEHTDMSQFFKEA